ncbi:MAG: dephospho-CoA kinase [Acidimicrobiia bacterium]|nr:dephospho-CoA kinase [Acidimicrobiia bacterium]
MSQDGNTRRPRRVIVSGGIGSGKTTVLSILARLGAVVIEADRIGHEILAPGGTAFEHVAQRWPQVVVDGRIDRGGLAAIVFSDSEELRALERISHPLIAAEIARRVAEVDDLDVVLELPVAGGYVDEGWTRIAVTAPEELRLRRSVARGMDESDVADRMTAQERYAGWLDGADITIENTGDLGQLEERVREAWEQLGATA